MPNTNTDIDNKLFNNLYIFNKESGDYIYFIFNYLLLINESKLIYKLITY